MYIFWNITLRDYLQGAGQSILLRMNGSWLPVRPQNSDIIIYCFCLLKVHFFPHLPHSEKSTKKMTPSKTLLKAHPKTCDRFREERQPQALLQNVNIIKNMSYTTGYHGSTWGQLLLYTKIYSLDGDKTPLDIEESLTSTKVKEISHAESLLPKTSHITQ